MKYNINHQYKIIFFWAPKSGVMSLIKLMTYLKLEEQLPMDELAIMTNRSLYSLYRQSIFEAWDKAVDYSSFKTFFFGRNPFHRIISCYIDKYVNPLSATPAAIPDCKTYEEFLAILCSTGLKKDSMAHQVDFGHFCPVTDDLGWKIYCRLGKPRFNYISILPSTALPEAALTHSFKNIQDLFVLLNIEEKYSCIQRLYENHNCSYDTWLKNKPNHLMDIDAAILSKEELWKLISPSDRQRTISYSSFYPSVLAHRFYSLYRDEFDFYLQRGYDFSHP